MALRINTNTEAINTLRNLTISQNMFDTSMQRLSSGKRINSAADDAAGYAISQKLMAQNNGLTQASSNAQDGISMIQTASGGLQTTQQLLQRMRQLAVQSANDTNTTTDRQALQSEADQINQEITQIATTTQFNTKNLLDGTMGATGTTTGTSTIGGVSSGASITNAGTLASGLYSLNVTAVGVAGATSAVGASTGTAATGSVISSVNGLETDTTTTTDRIASGFTGNLVVTGSKGNATVSISGTDTFQNVMDKINAFTNQTGVTASFAAGASNAGIKLTNSQAGSSQSVSVTGADILTKALGLAAAGAAAGSTTQNATVTASGTDGAATLTPNGGSAITLTAAGNVFKDASSGFNYDLSGDSTLTTGTTGVFVNNNGASLQVGANAGQSLTVSIGNMQASALGVQSTTNASQALDISSSATAASSAITTIDSAIQTVSTQAANLGAVQNRLQSAINNLAIGSENMQAAYSSITDVNMAQESTNLASAQILQQSGIAMLAQANQAPQGVLKLLG